MSIYTPRQAPSIPMLGSALLDRHFFRTYGWGAYYGQPIQL